MVRPRPKHLEGRRSTKTVRFERFVGGRLLEVYDLESGDGCELARITEWEPPHELRFVGDRDVEVAVMFLGAPDGCLVTVEERGLDRLSAADAAHVRRWGWHATLPGWFADFARISNVR